MTNITYRLFVIQRERGYDYNRQKYNSCLSYDLYHIRIPKMIWNSKSIIVRILPRKNIQNRHKALLKIHDSWYIINSSNKLILRFYIPFTTLFSSLVMTYFILPAVRGFRFKWHAYSHLRRWSYAILYLNHKEWGMVKWNFILAK